MFEVTAVVLNAARLKRKLARLNRVQQRKAVRIAARTSAKPLHLAIKAAAPKDTGLLRKSIKLRAMKKSRTRVGVSIILSEVDLAKTTNKALSKKVSKKRRQEIVRPYRGFYGAFIELGTKHIEARHFMKKTAKRMGRARQKDFMRRVAKEIERMMKGDT